MANKNVSLFFLIISALLFSGGMLRAINDPEGPNLLIVAVFAAVGFAVSLAVNYFHSGTFIPKGTTRVVIGIVAQLIAFIILYFFLN